MSNRLTYEQLIKNIYCKQGIMPRTLEEIAKDLRALADSLDKASKDERVVIARKCQPYVEELGLNHFSLLDIISLPVKMVYSHSKEGLSDELQEKLTRKCFAIHELINILESHKRISQDEARQARQKVFKTLVDTINSNLFQYAAKKSKSTESHAKSLSKTKVKSSDAATPLGSISSMGSSAKPLSFNLIPSYFSDDEQARDYSASSRINMISWLGPFNCRDRFDALVSESKLTKLDAVSSINILWQMNKIRRALKAKYTFSDSRCKEYQKGALITLRDLAFQKEIEQELSEFLACDKPISDVIIEDVSRNRLRPLAWQCHTMQEYTSSIVKKEMTTLEKLRTRIESVKTAKRQNLAMISDDIKSLKSLRINCEETLEQIHKKETKSKKGSNIQAERLMLAKAKRQSMELISSCDNAMEHLKKKESKLKVLVEKCRKKMADLSSQSIRFHLIGKDELTSKQQKLLDTKTALEKLILCIAGYEHTFTSIDKTILLQNKEVNGLLKEYMGMTESDPLVVIEEEHTRQRTFSF